MFQINDYEVHIGKWVSQAFGVYKQHWVIFSLFTLFTIGVSAIPYVGPIFALPLHFGIFFATCNKVRSGQLGGTFSPHDLFRPYYHFVPLLVLCFVVALLVFLGFFLCIIPGLYLIVVLSFSALLYVEYSDMQITMINALKLSQKAVRGHFWGIAGFIIVNFFLAISGILLLGVGILITIPIAAITVVFAYRDIFGLRLTKAPVVACVCV